MTNTNKYQTHHFVQHAQNGDYNTILRSPRFVRLATMLESATNRTVPLEELWRLWAVADPESASQPDRRTRLAQTVKELTEAGLVTPSKKQDSHAKPYLPVKLTLPAPAPSKSAAELARSIAWRPELAWVLRSRLTLGQVEQIRLINNWLRDRGQDNDVIPLRERSLEVLGHEKDLDRLLSTQIFASGRLSLALLRTFRTHPPLPVVRVGSGPVLLVIENEDTFHSVRMSLDGSPGQVGHIAWGAGGSFEASVRSVSDLNGVERVRYFGDLDASGLRIPRNAAKVSASEELPPVTPALDLYRALLENGVPQHGQPILTLEQTDSLVGWLNDPRLTLDVSKLLRTGVRLPQEWLSSTWFNRNQFWLDSL